MRFPLSGIVAVRVYLSSDHTIDVSRTTTAAALPRYGDSVSLHGLLEHPAGVRNPGGIDFGSALGRREISASMLVRRAEEMRLLPRSGRSGNLFLGLAYSLRQHVIDSSHRALPLREAGALNGILLGERADLPAALRDSFERTGTSHILATAGLHVGMVVVILLGLQLFFTVTRKLSVWVTLCALCFYVVMAGGRPSVSRAVVMAAVYLVGLILEREPDLFNALSVAALILLILHPLSLTDPGFQLSFATVITIVLWMPFAKGWLESLRGQIPGDGRRSRIARRIVESITVCFLLAVASQLGSGPLVAYYFHIISPISIVANTLVVPVIALIIALGFTASAAGAVSMVLARPVYSVLFILLSYVIGIVQTCSSLPFAAFAVESPPPAGIMLYYVVLWGAAVILSRRGAADRVTPPAP